MQKIKLNNARLSFPNLYKKVGFIGGTPKFSATFLLCKDQHADTIVKINKMIDDFIADKYGAGKVPKGIKRTCFSNGDDKDYDGYENTMVFKASSTKRLTLLDRDKTPVTEDDNVFYAGCYVNVVVSLWFSDHELGGKQVLANIHGIQFNKDGEEFGNGNNNCSDDFDEVEDDSDDF